ncbi:shikimate kinase [Anaerosporobacter sp.]|uniref:shikimate kinase n=1 Tax=Anaerosporobacter sp. TaxID=1872529 RepID=UPI00289E0CC8|nr:shikimate kinase [Anaerosporobacter sp.]
MINTYYIGGSPCSGKSTIAEILSAKYNLYYFKVDDFLEKYTKMGTVKGYKICKNQDSMNAEETWMREPSLQCREEFLFYEEIFEFIWEDLRQITGKGIITEGAAYLPKLMKGLNISKDRYISITPSEDFQISHYKKREWVPFVLEGCKDKEKAFSNWMNRDILFAQEVQRQCNEEKYVSIINDGCIELDELVNKVVVHLGLGE